MDTFHVIRRAKQRFREEYVWTLLPLLFAICFLNVTPSWATTQFRVLILLPLLWVLRFDDLRLIWSNQSARAILVLFAWLTLTLAWDGIGHEDWQILRKEIQVLAVFYLVFLQSRYQPEKSEIVRDLFLFSGVLWAVLVVIDWYGIKDIAVGSVYRESTRGVFSHHVYVGWMMAVLATIAFWEFVRAANATWLYLISFAFLAFMTLLIQSRGGYLVFFSGLLIATVIAGAKRLLLPSALFLVALPALFLLLHEHVVAIYDNVLERGVAGRFDIWGNGYKAITESIYSFLFGHGLSVNAENSVNDYVADHYHSFFINLVFYSGVIGLALYLMVLACLMQKVLREKSTRLWAVILVSMQFGFLVDGDSLFVNPSAMMLCVILPVGMIAFSGPQLEVRRPALISRA